MDIMEILFDMNKKIIGHLLAIVTVCFWGTTFTSTKILLRTFTPVEILTIRFAIGYLLLLAIRPGIIRMKPKQEVYYILTSLAGVGLYYILENTALQFTSASNAGVIISTAPFFTALLSHFNGKNRESFKWNFLLGFVFAIIGIFLISFNGARMDLNPIGDIMIVLCALSWAFYNILLKTVQTYGHDLILSTRRIFFWGLVAFAIYAPFTDYSISFSTDFSGINILNLLLLGAGASACGFLLWNKAVSIIGPVQANFYIYLTPVVTLVASIIVLNEQMTVLLAAGTILTLAGLIVSELKFKR